MRPSPLLLFDVKIILKILIVIDFSEGPLARLSPWRYVSAEKTTSSGPLPDTFRNRPGRRDYGPACRQRGASSPLTTTCPNEWTCAVGMYFQPESVSQNPLDGAAMSGCVEARTDSPTRPVRLESPLRCGVCNGKSILVSHPSDIGQFAPTFAVRESTMQNLQWILLPRMQ